MRSLSVLVCGAALLLAGCRDDSYAVVSVLTYAGALDGVAQFRVHAGNQNQQDELYYPRQPSESLHLDTSHAVTFSVEFDSGRGGDATFEVEPLDRNGATLGYGRSVVALNKGKVVDVSVLVVVSAVRPERGLDGGAANDAGATQLVCDPYAPTVTCGGAHTCGLLCTAGQPAVGMCYAAGVGKPGEACTGNSDCGPGSQCFTFTAAGCAVRTCLRFCDHSDSACGEANAFCNVPIHCGSTSPDFAACSRPCDPTGGGTIGCAPGLACFVYAGETTDCACSGLGDEGASCTQNSGCNGELGCGGCRAGLSCVVPSGSASSTGTCRSICSLAAPACPLGTTCHAFSGSTRLLYGFCQ